MNKGHRVKKEADDQIGEKPPDTSGRGGATRQDHPVKEEPHVPESKGRMEGYGYVKEEVTQFAQEDQPPRHQEDRRHSHHDRGGHADNNDKRLPRQLSPSRRQFHTSNHRGWDRNNHRHFDRRPETYKNGLNGIGGPGSRRHQHHSFHRNRVSKDWRDVPHRGHAHRRRSRERARHFSHNRGHHSPAPQIDIDPFRYGASATPRREIVLQGEEESHRKRDTRAYSPQSPEPLDPYPSYPVQHPLTTLPAYGFSHRWASGNNDQILGEPCPYSPSSPNYSPVPPAYQPESPTFRPASPVYRPESPVYHADFGGQYSPSSPIHFADSWENTIAHDKPVHARITRPACGLNRVYSPHSPVYQRHEQFARRDDPNARNAFPARPWSPHSITGHFDNIHNDNASRSPNTATSTSNCYDPTSPLSYVFEQDASMRTPNRDVPDMPALHNSRLWTVAHHNEHCDANGPFRPRSPEPCLEFRRQGRRFEVDEVSERDSLNDIPDTMPHRPGFHQLTPFHLSWMDRGFDEHSANKEIKKWFKAIPEFDKEPHYSPGPLPGDFTKLYNDGRELVEFKNQELEKEEERQRQNVIDDWKDMIFRRGAYSQPFRGRWNANRPTDAGFHRGGRQAAGRDQEQGHFGPQRTATRVPVMTSAQKRVATTAPNTNKNPPKKAPPVRTARGGFANFAAGPKQTPPVPTASKAAHLQPQRAATRLPVVQTTCKTATSVLPRINTPASKAEPPVTTASKGVRFGPQKAATRPPVIYSAPKRVASVAPAIKSSKKKAVKVEDAFEDVIYIGSKCKKKASQKTHITNGDLNPCFLGAPAAPIGASDWKKWRIPKLDKNTG